MITCIQIVCENLPLVIYKNDTQVWHDYKITASTVNTKVGATNLMSKQQITFRMIQDVTLPTTNNLLVACLASRCPRGWTRGTAACVCPRLWCVLQHRSPRYTWAGCWPWWCPPACGWDHPAQQTRPTSVYTSNTPHISLVHYIMVTSSYTSNMPHVSLMHYIMVTSSCTTNTPHVSLMHYILVISS